MEGSSDLRFSDSTSSTPITNPFDAKVADGNCPVCWQNNKIRKIVPLHYKMREAIYTCEDTNCLYFITDDFGNLQKFTKTDGSLKYSGSVIAPKSDSSHFNVLHDSNGTSHLQSAPAQSNEIVDTSSYLDDLFNSEPNNDEVKSLMNELSSLFEPDRTEK